MKGVAVGKYPKGNGMQIRSTAGGRPHCPSFKDYHIEHVPCKRTQKDTFCGHEAEEAGAKEKGMNTSAILCIWYRIEEGKATHCHRQGCPTLRMQPAG